MEHIFTFGFGSNLANCFTVIEAEDGDEARKKMFAEYGPHFAFQYTSREQAGVDKYNMREVPFGTEQTRLNY